MLKIKHRFAQVGRRRVLSAAGDQREQRVRHAPVSNPCQHLHKKAEQPTPPDACAVLRKRKAWGRRALRKLQDVPTREVRNTCTSTRQKGSPERSVTGTRRVRSCHCAFCYPPLAPSQIRNFHEKIDHQIPRSLADPGKFPKFGSQSGSRAIASRPLLEKWRFFKNINLNI